MNIAIIGQNSIFRDSLRTLLNQVDDFNVMMDSENIQDFFDTHDALSIDIVLFDGSIGNGNYIDLISKVRIFSADIKVLILTDIAGQTYWKNQSSGIIEGTLLKNSKKKEFAEKIRSLV
jgi:DNA-binding NarL/FixJ family response regulator